MSTKKFQTHNEVRDAFLNYYAKNWGNQVADSSALVPANDPTLLFTNAGMVQFKGAFLGEEKLAFNEACSSQKCLRAGGKHNDLEQVGFTARHHTFFEMLGNFVFSGASKSKAIAQAWELLTEVYGLDKDRLWVTVYHEDDASRQVWINEIGLTPDRVIDCGEADNFWSMGDVGPCGPCTEIFYDHGPEVPGGKPGSEDQDGDRYVEIWNLVFMQYEMKADGSRVDLPALGLDTGMGIERIAAVLQGSHNNFDTDLFMPIIDKVKTLAKNVDLTTARVIADHIKSAVFLIADGVYPSNEGRGYVLRRIIRRAIGFAYKEGITDTFFASLTDEVCAIYAKPYPYLLEKQPVIIKILSEEEARFSQTITQGMRLLETKLSEKGATVSGADAFKLYDTYGFPVDMTTRIAEANGCQVDMEEYESCMQTQQERSRANAQFDYKTSAVSTDLVTTFVGYDKTAESAKVQEIFSNDVTVSSLEASQKGLLILDQTVFYPEGGGQVGDQGWITMGDAKFIVEDTQRLGKAIAHIGYVESGALNVNDEVNVAVDAKRQATVCNHSATHLLHAALRALIGEHVLQKGSLVTPERLRFDFAHSKPLTFEEIQSVERCVNDEIRRNHMQEAAYMPLAEARKQKVMALFDEKYEDPVRVMKFGEFSRELCGGVHVRATGEIGLFVVVQETGIASGVRRIEALTGSAAMAWLQAGVEEKQKLVGMLKTDQAGLVEKTENLIADLKKSRKQITELLKKRYAQEASTWIADAQSIKHGLLICQIVEITDMKALRAIMDTVKSKLESGVIVLIGQSSEQSPVLVSSVNSGYDSKKIIDKLAEIGEGRGGGKPAQAQGMINHVSPDLAKEMLSWIDACYAES